MQDFAAAIAEALRLIATFDADLAEIVGLSLQVSLAASFCAALIGLPVGALIAIGSFRGRSILSLLLNALMGLPPVVVGSSSISCCRMPARWVASACSTRPRP
jgi:tungstate transport system permease protein